MPVFCSSCLAHTKSKQITRLKSVYLKTFFFVINFNYKKYFFVLVLIGSVQEHKLKYQDVFTTFLLWLDLDSILAFLKACFHGAKNFC